MTTWFLFSFPVFGASIAFPREAKQMLDLFETRAKIATGQRRVENSILRAQRIITEELDRLGWTSEQLSARADTIPSNSPSPPKPHCTGTFALATATLPSIHLAGQKEFVGL